ncbi:hypothetical protein Mterra_01010 [Calidithermus terrae]|uniref:Uncharacterized protein n=1 Tax=Calidithermus terrae TaxID=1408545 RepID=A0A399EXH8_9DEIN|nr:hypothetical protein [Calidithermus terrae]RIH88305.1 hypothetical protein Mterra_01010 [Calidithermus terrae]
MKRYLVFAVLALIALNACVPAGGSQYSPLEAQAPLGSVKIPAGQTSYVAVEYGASYWDIPTSTIRQVLPANFSSSTRAGEVTRGVMGGFKVENLKVSNGWKVELAASNAKRRITDVDSTSVYFRDTVELVFAVTPAAGDPGALVLMDVRYGSQVKPVMLTITVTQGK